MPWPDDYEEEDDKESAPRNGSTAVDDASRRGGSSAPPPTFRYETAPEEEAAPPANTYPAMWAVEHARAQAQQPPENRPEEDSLPEAAGTAGAEAPGKRAPARSPFLPGDLENKGRKQPEPSPKGILTANQRE
jgi:hypothetical protein